jgi:NitT/TauT family transport system ATP-binding protein
MFQQPHLYPWMTAAQNVGLGLKFAGEPRGKIRERVRSLLTLVELEDYASRNVQELSGGQQQRVALARSLAVHPDVLFLDEPFSALDTVTRRTLQRDVKRIATEFGITLVIVTHDIAEAMIMADRAIVMAADPGRVTEIIPFAGSELPRSSRDADAEVLLQAAFERASGLGRDAAAARNAESERGQMMAASHG